MMFSVLVPVYNVKPFLEECISSVLNQTFKDFELILVDDGSSDGSEIICDSFRGHNVKVIHKKNEGLLIARRVGINSARGDYCIFLDSDDKLAPNCLELINSEIIANRLDLLIYNLYIWDYMSDKIVEKPPVFDHETLFDKPADYSVIRRKFITSDVLNNLWIKAVKTSILLSDDINYADKSFNDFGEDAVQSFHIFNEAKRIKYIPTPLYYYRINPNSISRKYRSFDSLKLAFEDGFEALKNTYLNKWEMNDNAAKEAISVCRLESLRTIFWSNYLMIASKNERKEYVKNDWPSLTSRDSFLYLNSRQIRPVHRFEISCIKNKNYLALEIIRLIRSVKIKLKL